MEFRKIKEIVEFNPTEHLKKGTVAKKISMEKLENFKKYIRSYDIEQYSGGTKFKNGDTLLARITPCLENGKTAKVTVLEKNEIGFGSTEYIVMRSIENVSDEDYIYYLAISPEFRNIAIKSMTGTSGRQRVQLDVVKNTKMKLSNYKEQVKIGKVLSVLDDKIQLNNQINDNLFEVIRTLYIEKIRDNEKFEYEFKDLKKLANIFTGKKNANANIKDGKYKFFTCAPESLKINTYIYDGPAVIIAGNGAYTGRTTFYNGKFDLYQRTYAITEKDKNNEENIYLIYAAIITDLQYNIMGGTHGSAIPYIVMDDIATFKIKYNKDIFNVVSKQIKSLLLKIKENESQNETLSQLRDTLLPKLMNGEIDLDKIEI